MTVSNSLDNAVPVASITNPVNGAIVGGTITAAVTATDDIGVTRVELLVDGAVFASRTTSPFTFTLVTTMLANGSHTLVARAFDAAGKIGTSNTVTVEVRNASADTELPVTAITSPANGSIVRASSTLTITASASDNIGVTRVDGARRRSGPVLAHCAAVQLCVPGSWKGRQDVYPAVAGVRRRGQCRFLRPGERPVSEVI